MATEQERMNESIAVDRLSKAMNAVDNVKVPPGEFANALNRSMTEQYEQAQRTLESLQSKRNTIIIQIEDVKKSINMLRAGLDAHKDVAPVTNKARYDSPYAELADKAAKVRN